MSATVGAMRHVARRPTAGWGGNAHRYSYFRCAGCSSATVTPSAPGCG